MDWEKFGFRKGYDYNNRVVKQEYINFEGKIYFVSTVDLGINHNLFAEEPPLYYETMIFEDDSRQDMYCNRYTSKEEALKSHEALVYNILHGNYEIVDGYFEEI